MALVFKTPKTAINTTTRDIQNIKDGECPPCPECPEVELTTAEVEYTENGSFTVTPESGFDGLSQVDITVNIDTQAIEDAAYAEGEAAGISEQKAKLTSTTITQNGTSTREDGWNSVTVNVQPTLQSKTINPATVIQGVQADAGYDGLSNVTVNAVTSSIDSNIQPENILEGITILGVDGTDQGYATGYDEGFQAGQEQCGGYQSPWTLDETITENGTYTFNPSDYCTDTDPDSGDCITMPDCFDQVNITVDVAGGAVESGKTYNADRVGTFTVSPSSGYDAMDGVVVEVSSVPIGSMDNPWEKNMYFDYNFDNTNFIGAYFGGTVSNGSINSTTGKYDARIGSTITLHIDPFYDTGDMDPDTGDLIIAFPPNFDLVGKDIIVAFEKQNVTKTGNNYDFANCGLVSIDGNSNQDTWLQEPNCPDWSTIGWDCNDVAASGITGDVAVTAALYENYDPTDTSLANMSY